MTTYGTDEPDFPAGCAIVFGASGGLGEACAGLLAERGSDVVLTYRSRSAETEKLAEQLRKSGRRATAVRCDTTERQDVIEAVNAAVNEYGRVHTVVSATGRMLEISPLVDVDPQAFREAIEIDVIGFFNIAQAIIPALRAGGGGSIVAIETTAVSRTIPHDAMSGTPKAAIDKLVKHIAVEEGANGIRANGIGSGVIEAGMTIPLRNTAAAPLLAVAHEWTPLGRLGCAHEIAEAVAFLASSRASYITGQLLMVDGGIAAA